MVSYFKDQKWTSPKYQEFITRQGACFRCGSARLPGERLHPHHERIGGLGGTALKPSDVFLLPICGECHNIRHSTAFVTLADFFKDENHGWNADVRKEMTKARLYAAMLWYLSSFLTSTKIQVVK